MKRMPSANFLDVKDITRGQPAARMRAPVPVPSRFTPGQNSTPGTSESYQFNPSHYVASTSTRGTNQAPAPADVRSGSSADLDA